MERGQKLRRMPPGILPRRVPARNLPHGWHFSDRTLTLCDQAEP